MTSTLDFLQALYGDDGPQGVPYILLISGGEKPHPKVLWPSSLESMANVAASEDGKNHVYFGVCPSKTKLLNNQKPKSVDVSSVPALWMDIDVGKPGVPATREDALAIIEAFPFKPTILVDSGNGFHAYWVLKEPIEIGTPGKNAEATALSKAWQKFFANTARCKFDTTGNLDRVLRLPGARNIKRADGAMCSVVYMDGPQYLAEDLSRDLDVERVDVDKVNSMRRDETASLFSLSPGDAYDKIIPIPAYPGMQVEGYGAWRPRSMFGVETDQIIDALHKGYRAFRAMFTDPRDDEGRPLKKHDLSREFTIALRLYFNMCVNSGTNPTRQVCFDLNTYIRDMNWSKPEDINKAVMRPGVVESVIRSFAESTRALPKRGEGGGEGGSEGEQADPAQQADPQGGDGEGGAEGGKKSRRRPEKQAIDAGADIASARELLESMLGSQLGNVLRLIGTTPQEYSIEVFAPGKDEPDKLYVTVEQITRWTKFHDAWISATGRPAQNVMTQNEWMVRGVPKLLRIAIPDHTVLEETTEVGQIKLAMIAYLNSHHIYPSIEEAYDASQPFTHTRDGVKGVWYFSTPLSNYVSQALKGEGLSPRQVCRVITRSKLSAPVQIAFTAKDGKQVKPRVFRFPDDVVRRAGQMPASVFGIAINDCIQETGEAPCFEETAPTQ